MVAVGIHGYNAGSTSLTNRGKRWGPAFGFNKHLEIIAKVNVSVSFFLCCLVILQGKNHNIPLKTLVLNGCSSVSDELISQISRVLFNLQELDLSSCLHVTDIGLSAITGSLINLHSLRLSWCVNITDNGLIGFVQSEQNLAHVCHNKEKCSHAEKFKNDVNLKANRVSIHFVIYSDVQCKNLVMITGI